MQRYILNRNYNKKLSKYYFILNEIKTKQLTAKKIYQLIEKAKTLHAELGFETYSKYEGQ